MNAAPSRHPACSFQGVDHPYFSHWPRQLTVFQWHGDTYTLPQGAVNCAKASSCEQQAFVFGENVLALQFHLEVSAPGVTGMVENLSSDLRLPSPTVQTADAITGGTEYLTELKIRLYQLLNVFFRGE